LIGADPTTRSVGFAAFAEVPPNRVKPRTRATPATHAPMSKRARMAPRSMPDLLSRRIYEFDILPTVHSAGFGVRAGRQEGEA
jgi:hypothetical protein